MTSPRKRKPAVKAAEVQLEPNAAVPEQRTLSPLARAAGRRSLSVLSQDPPEPQQDSNPDALSQVLAEEDALKNKRVDGEFVEAATTDDRLAAVHTALHRKGASAVYTDEHGQEHRATIDEAYANGFANLHVPSIPQIHRANGVPFDPDGAPSSYRLAE